jgi:hypothetical protein
MKLEDTHKDNIFKVPDNYFEDFPGRLQKRIAGEEAARKTLSIRIRPLISVAAAAVILVFVAYGITRLSNRLSPVDRILSNVSTEELINYLVESEISTEEFLESIDIAVISSSEDPFDEDFISSEPIDDETIDELLDEYEIEMEYL